MTLPKHLKNPSEPAPPQPATGLAATEHLTLALLAWVSDGERTYGETMEAWRSTCPRLSIWEDAVRDGLVRVESGGVMKSCRVALTAEGTSRLRRNR
jgi:hypothetical protein